MTTLREHLEAILDVASDHCRPNAAAEIRERSTAALNLIESVVERLKTIQFALTVDEHVAASRVAEVAIDILGDSLVSSVPE